MKLLFFCCFFIVAAFSQSQTSRLEDEYEASLDAWQTLNPRAYTFVVISEVLVAEPTKYRIGRTTIKVRNDQVVSRSYVEKEPVYYPGEVAVSWSETTPETLGTNEGGYPASTFDDVYNDCLNNILSYPDPDTDGYAKLDVDSNGLISRCGYYGSNAHAYINIESVKYCR